jgi:hypothetical protein
MYPQLCELCKRVLEALLLQQDARQLKARKRIGRVGRDGLPQAGDGTCSAVHLRQGRSQ